MADLDQLEAALNSWEGFGLPWHINEGRALIAELRAARALIEAMDAKIGVSREHPSVAVPLAAYLRLLELEQVPPPVNEHDFDGLERWEEARQERKKVLAAYQATREEAHGG